MRDLEFDLLLKAVSTAVADLPEEDSLARALPRPQPLPRAANDNERPWPLIPFPDGWSGSC